MECEAAGAAVYFSGGAKTRRATKRKQKPRRPLGRELLGAIRPLSDS